MGRSQDWRPGYLLLSLLVFLSTILTGYTVYFAGLIFFQRSQTQSPTPPKPPSPSFELGLSSFPPLPGAAGHLKTEDLFENRLSSLLIGTSKERVRCLLPAWCLLTFMECRPCARHLAGLFTMQCLGLPESKGLAEATQILSSRARVDPWTGPS